MKKQEVNLKYLESLRELHKVLKYTDRISLTKFMNKNSLNKNFANIIIKGGLIKTNGVKGAGTRYEWITIDPNIKMSSKVIEEVNKESLKGMQKTRGGARVGSGRKTKEVENRLLESYTTNLLWGLIKITTKLNYKTIK